MKDEIKEINIPENVLIALGDLTNGALNYYKATETVKVKYSTVLDYITNLQEENDILKRDIEAMKHNYNLLVKCIENGESMTQKFENGLTYQDYKSRNEKAIEYIENNMPYLEEPDDDYENTHKMKEYDKSVLLNILQGSDKDE